MKLAASEAPPMVNLPDTTRSTKATSPATATTTWTAITGLRNAYFSPWS